MEITRIIIILNVFLEGIQFGEYFLLFTVADEIQCCIYHDFTHPGFDAAGLLKIPDIVDDFHEAIVKHILCILAVSRIAQAHCQQPGGMAIVQYPYGSLVEAFGFSVPPRKYHPANITRNSEMVAWEGVIK